MMHKEFKVYKSGKGEYTLLESRDVSLRHRHIRIEPAEETFEVHDALWALDDKERNLTSNIMVIDEILGPWEFIVVQGNGGFIKEGRELLVGEKLTLISTFRKQ